VNQAFTYDQLDRLTNATGIYGTRAYTYDADDNRTSQTANGVTSNYNYATTSNELLSVTTGITNRTLGYTATGNVTSDSQTGNTNTYNARNRLSILNTNGSPAAYYSYDATGMRVRKRMSTTASHAVTHFHYDPSGHLLAETEDTHGGTLREYIWLDDLPVAQLDATGKVSYLHTDHLNTPLIISDSTQSVAWSRTQTPFGEDFSQTGTNTSLLRMPGQYYDAEAGTDYNAMRNYDPASGRYLQTDPSGLNGGINTFGYVSGNPVNAVDPLGLETCIAGGYCDPHPAPQMVQQEIDLLMEPLWWLAAGQGTKMAGIKICEKAAPFIARNSPLFARGSGLLNSNDYLRIGWNWEGPAIGGQNVFRIAIGSKRGWLHWHWTLWGGGP
jgi:RHS repeat-associated protein